MAIKGRHHRTQKNQQLPAFDEESARTWFESLRWPNGPICPHCGSIQCYRLQGEATRPGLLKCRDCKGQFTITVGTVMEDSHLPLSKWAMAFHLMCSSKKGISALQLQRNLGLGSYRTAWHLAHRIREAMRCDPVAGMLKGEVQVDETFVGRRRMGGRKRAGDAPRKRGRGTSKIPVVALVETGGKMHSRPIQNVDAKTLKAAMQETVDPSACIVTDEYSSYPKAAAGFAGHYTVRHADGQYVDSRGFTTNTAESYFALLKRGIHGSFHHVSKHHLHRYCDEFAFRWNGRTITDVERRNLAVKGAEGKRLFLYKPVGDA